MCTTLRSICFPLAKVAMAKEAAAKEAAARTAGAKEAAAKVAASREAVYMAAMGLEAAVEEVVHDPLRQRAVRPMHRAQQRISG